MWKTDLFLYVATMLIYLGSFRNIKYLTLGHPLFIIMFCIIDYFAGNKDFENPENVITGNLLLNESTILYLAMMVSIFWSSPSVMHMTVFHIPILCVVVPAYSYRLKSAVCQEYSENKDQQYIDLMIILVQNFIFLIIMRLVFRTEVGLFLEKVKERVVKNQTEEILNAQNNMVLVYD
jgi:hypothetical protein